MNRQDANILVTLSKLAEAREADRVATEQFHECMEQHGRFLRMRLTHFPYPSFRMRAVPDASWPPQLVAAAEAVEATVKVLALMEEEFHALLLAWHRGEDVVAAKLGLP